MARSSVRSSTPITYPSSEELPIDESDFQRGPLTYAVEALRIYFKAHQDVYVSGNLFRDVTKLNYPNQHDNTLCSLYRRYPPWN